MSLFGTIIQLPLFNPCLNALNVAVHLVRSGAH